MEGSRPQDGIPARRADLGKKTLVMIQYKTASPGAEPSGLKQDEKFTILCIEGPTEEGVNKQIIVSPSL